MNQLDINRVAYEVDTYTSCGFHLNCSSFPTKDKAREYANSERSKANVLVTITEILIRGIESYGI